MSKSGKPRDPRVKANFFAWRGFILSFLVLAALTTGQMFMLQNYFINYFDIPGPNVIAVIIYWVLGAAAFTLFTKAQFTRHYQRPMAEFAEATRQVAGGDFSVYISPRHIASKHDYMDAIIMDFNVMVEALGSIETLKTDFFSNVSHEIKTPLSIIQNYAQGLKDGNLNEVQREAYIDTILESSTRLSELISNILKLNKLEKQTLQPITEPYDVCAQLCECALRFEDIWAEKGIEFEADIEDRATIEADASLMELVWNNLISNAVKFTEPGGTITLRQTSTNDEIVVCVTDTGCGMTEETLARIFDKFYQGDTSHSTEGNGLGLALVLRILQLVGGSIDVSSVAGRGTTFTVHVPSQRRLADN